MSCALWLQRVGREVIVVDSNEPGSGASYGNAGCLNGSSIVPMSLPGMRSSIPSGWLPSFANHGSDRVKTANRETTLLRDLGIEGKR
ncbi:hypothetical protein [Aureimonas populi]|nr:hypothetical protein [Aureimonas populi]